VIRRHAWTVVLAVAYTLAWPGGAAAQQNDVPPEVALLAAFGVNGKLTLAGLKGHLAETEFASLDADEDGALSVEEYTAARLHLRPGSCHDLHAIPVLFDQDKQRAGGVLDAAGLVEANEGWRIHIDQLARSHWEKKALARPGDELDPQRVAAYLARLKEKPPAPTLAALEATLAAIVKAPLPDPVPEAALTTFFRDEGFAVLDADASGHIDAREFTAAFPSFEESAEFCALATDFVVAREALDRAVAAAPHFQRFVNRLMPPLFIGPMPLAEVRAHFRKLEEAAKAEAGLRDVSPHGFVAGYGYLVRGSRKVNDEKQIVHDGDTSAIFIRLVKDFTFDDPSTAEPATFAVAKEKGSPATIGIDATLQVDFDPTSKVLRRFSVGVDAERDTGTDPHVHRQRYYAAATLFAFKAGSPLESHVLRLAPYIENDDKKDVTRLAGDLIWTPGVHLGRFLTNYWMPIGRHAHWYVAPRLVAELATVLSEADPLPGTEARPAPDGSHARLEFLSGFKADRFNTTFKTIRRAPFDEALGFSHFEELSCWWNFDDLERFSIKVTAAWGKALPTDADNRSTLTTGLGIRF